MECRWCLPLQTRAHLTMENIEIFIGRFHPLIVHLPIGFLLLAAIMQGLLGLNKGKYGSLHLAITISIFLGFVSSLAAAAVGWLLAQGGGYDDHALFWHQWMGISVVILSLIAWLFRIFQSHLPDSIQHGLAAILILVVSIAGHLGGGLTHGEEYLFAYAPPVIQRALGNSAPENQPKIPSNVDSILVYGHLIQPILEAKCYECHNEAKKKGGLSLTSTKDIQEGGDSGPAIGIGHSLNSLLITRVTLPGNHHKFMPPKGAPLTYAEIQLFSWWIDEGASDEARAVELTPNPEVLNFLVRDYDLDLTPKSLVNRLQAEPLSREDSMAIAASGFTIRPIAMDHNLYEVFNSNPVLETNQLKILLRAKNQITKVFLSGCGIIDDQMFVFGQMPNLTYLNLDRNPISDTGLSELATLKNLEVLNLYGTEITIAAKNLIKDLPSLKRVYLWNTEIRPSAFKMMQEELSEVEVIGGIAP